mmetsp:Transcript_8538/g.15635  ORF Transcript_8538/g.15635 Transcript_8538/m.15635 type:complete len:169 (+) Transcript_8538:108-614(+)
MKFVSTLAVAVVVVVCSFFHQGSPVAEAFAPVMSSSSPKTTLVKTMSTFLTVLKMSDEPLDESIKLGEAERAILERKRKLDEGLVQSLGCTIKKDGLDGIRAFVWSLYHASNIIFPVLAVVMMATLGLNLAGYGYYWVNGDTGATLVVDTLEHIRNQNMWMIMEKSAL